MFLGIARKSCSRLVALMLRLEFLSPAVTKDYSLRDFKKEMKHFLELAGAQNKSCLLYIEDHHLMHPEFLELINSLISSGEIPGLYSQEEIEHLLAGNTEEIRQEFVGRSLYECFSGRIQRNLRIVLSLDCQNERFNANCAANPALYTKCDIVWLENWTKDSMNEIVELEVKEAIGELSGKEKEDLTSLFVTVHRLAGARGATPRHLFALADTFKKIYQGKKNSRGSQNSHLISGLNKLNEAKELVDSLTKQVH